MNFSIRIPTSIVGTTIYTTFVESLLWPPTAFLQILWEQPFPQSLWERYTLTNHARLTSAKNEFFGAAFTA